MPKLFSSLLRTWVQSVRAFFGNLRINRHRNRLVESDTALVAQLTRRRWPTLAQWKYLPRFLGTGERVILVLALIIALGSAGSLAAHLYMRYTIVVPARGGTYTEALVGAPRFLNPILAATNDVDLDITRLVFSGLFRRNEKLELEPDLIASYTISKDQKTYIFTLRDGLMFDDGEPITTRDVQFTIEAIQDPEWHSPLAPTLRGVSVNTIDEKTVGLILREPFAPFIENLTFGIVPEHLWGDMTPTDIPFAEENLTPVGNGPFRVAAVTRHGETIASIALSRNPRYHNTPPLLDTVVFTFAPDAESAVDLLAKKSVDGVSIVPERLRGTVERESRLTTYSLRTPQVVTLFFRTVENALTNDRGTRDALIASIDRSRILQTAWHGRGEIVQGMFPRDMIGGATDTPPITLDLTRAREQLKAAGWKTLARDAYTALWEKQERDRMEKTTGDTAKDSGKQGAPLLPEPAFDTYWEKGGTILMMTVTTSDTPEFVAAAEIIKNGWESIGIPTEIQVISVQRFARDAIQPRAYTTLLTSIALGADPDPYPFWHSSQVEHPGLNLSGFQNRDVDALLESARKTVSRDDRLAAYSKFQTILRKELPAFPMFNPTYVYALDRRVHGVRVDRMLVPADRFAALTNWYVKTKRVWK